MIFEISTDAINYQVGAVITVMAFYSQKQNYGVGEEKLFSIVECLEQFLCMPLFDLQIKKQILCSLKFIPLKLGELHLPLFSCISPTALP